MHRINITYLKIVYTCLTDKKYQYKFSSCEQTDPPLYYSFFFIYLNDCFLSTDFEHLTLTDGTVSQTDIDDLREPVNIKLQNVFI